MHRTTTTATLLVTVAVSALGGCTTVQHPPAPVAPTAPSRPPVPRPSGHTHPAVVQAPAREALTMVDPSRSPGVKPSAAQSSSPPPARPTPPHHEHHQPSRRPHSDPHGAKQPPVPIPDVSRSLPKEVPGNADLCALGKKYGGWNPDSPESRICEQTYGR